MSSDKTNATAAPLNPLPWSIKLWSHFHVDLQAYFESHVPDYH